MIKRILIADDEAHVIRVLKLMLEREGYTVEHAPNGVAALAIIRRAAPDVLVTDINMPGGDGRELCRAIAREFPDRRFPIFVMTSLTERAEREWSGSMAGVRFLEKPISPRNLIQQLRNLPPAPAQESAP